MTKTGFNFLGTFSLITTLTILVCCISFGFTDELYGLSESLIICLIYFIFSTVVCFKLPRVGVYISLFFFTILILSLIISFEYFAFFNSFISYNTLYLLEDFVRSFFSLVKYFYLLLASILALIICLGVVFLNNFHSSRYYPFPIKSTVFSSIFVILLFGFNSTKEDILNPMNVEIDYTFDFKSENPLFFFIRSLPFYAVEPSITEFLALSEGIKKNEISHLPKHLSFESFEKLIPRYNNYTHNESPVNPFEFIPISPLAKQSEKKKNVILIVLESIRELETREKFGIMPNFNRIKNQFIEIPLAYSTARLTIKSEQAMLCGLFDNIKDATYSRVFGEFNGDCLPSILKSNGYETLWFHGNSSVFYNRNVYHKSLGFNKLYDREEIEKISSTPLEEFGWGLSDVVVYEHALNQLSKQSAPFFAEILTVSNHKPFDWEYPEGTISPQFQNDSYGKYGNYLKGINYTDYALGLFWDKFQKSALKDNTLVIITGDHGVPYYPEEMTSEIEQHETLFRTPLYFYGLENEVVPNIKVSHLDITPTILSILSINQPQSFLGRPILGENKELSQRPIFNIGIADYSFKYGEIDCLPIRNFCDETNGETCYEDERFSCRVSSDDDVKLINQSKNLMKYMSLGNFTGFSSSKIESD